MMPAVAIMYWKTGALYFGLMSLIGLSLLSSCATGLVIWSGSMPFVNGISTWTATTALLLSLALFASAGVSFIASLSYVSDAKTKLMGKRRNRGRWDPNAISLLYQHCVPPTVDGPHKQWAAFLRNALFVLLWIDFGGMVLTNLVSGTSNSMKLASSGGHVVGASHAVDAMSMGKFTMLFVESYNIALHQTTLLTPGFVGLRTMSSFLELYVLLSFLFGGFYLFQSFGILLCTGANVSFFVGFVKALVKLSGMAVAVLLRMNCGWSIGKANLDKVEEKEEEEEKEGTNSINNEKKDANKTPQIVRPLIYEIACSTAIPDDARRAASVIAIGLTCFSLAIELESLLLIVNEHSRSSASFGISSLESLNSAVNFGIHGSMGIPFVNFFFQSKEIYLRARVASVVAGIIGMLASAFAVAWIAFGGEHWSTNSVTALMAIFCFRFCSFAMTTYGFYHFKDEMLNHVIDMQDKGEAFCGHSIWLCGSVHQGYEKVSSGGDDDEISLSARENRVSTSTTTMVLPREVAAFGLCFILYLFFIIMAAGKSSTCLSLQSDLSSMDGSLFGYDVVFHILFLTSLLALHGLMTKTFLTASITTFITGSTTFLSFSGLALFLVDSGTRDELPSAWMVVLSLLLLLCVLSSGALSVSTGCFVAELIRDSRTVAAEAAATAVEACESAGAVEAGEEKMEEESKQGAQVDYYQQLAEGFDRMSRW